MREPNLLKQRNLVCVAMLGILPVSLLADDTAGAILRSNGPVLLNKQPALVSSAIYNDDLIETQQNATARIQASGSMADINPETMLQYEDDQLLLDHGSLEINTSRGWRVRVGCRTVAPLSDASPTRYQVADLNGQLTVAALSHDVYMDTLSSALPEGKQSAHASRLIVHEGQRISRDDKCEVEETKESDRLAAKGAILDSLWARGIGIGAIGVLTCWALCFHHDQPVSPAKPQN